VTVDDREVAAPALKRPCDRPEVVTARSLEGLLNDLKQHLRRAFALGGRGVAAELLALHPELQNRRDHAFELLYEEYQLLSDVDDDIDLAEFCRDYPWFADELDKQFAAQWHESSLIRATPALSLDPHVVHWPQPGDRLAGFEIVDHLGDGASARVYLASEPALGDRLVAIKVSPHRSPEAATLGKLVHANIVPVHSVTFDEAGGLAIVCMPYLGRVTLHDVCWRLFCGKDRPSHFAWRRSPLPDAAPLALPRRGRAVIESIDRLNQVGHDLLVAPADPLLARRSYVEAVVHLAAQLADALAYTHAKGVFHGDLKPANVLLAPGGRPMLLDFNLANATNQVDFDVGGTVPYMAPERLIAAATAHEVAIDPRSDIFSLGVMLYQSLCGAHPFAGLPDGPPSAESAAWMWQRQRSGPRPVPLEQRNVDVDPPLARVVERCLSFAPLDRPADAAELAGELRRQLARPRRLRRWVRGHRWLATAAAALLLAVSFVGGYVVATRPPYFQRRFDEAVAAYERGQYEEAEHSLTKAIDHGGRSWQAYLRRGLARQRMDAHVAALDDYQAASALHRCREIEARIADCYCRPPKFEWATAIGRFRRAIEQGLECAAVHNNLGLCLQNQGELDEARGHFARAIALAPAAPAPYFNRALVEWKLAFGRQCSVGSQALEDIERAMKLGAPSADVLTYAARMYVFKSDDEGRHQKALDCLAEAVRAGAMVDHDPVLAALVDELRKTHPRLAPVGAASQRKKGPAGQLMDLPEELDVAGLAAR
jgi:serine/threonine protein kinase/Tfp pilus assembly protein PilF